MRERGRNTEVARRGAEVGVPQQRLYQFVVLGVCPPDGVEVVDVVKVPMYTFWNM